MLPLLFSSPLVFFISLASLILSIAVHEFAHAWVADRLGDPTPRAQGRVTLNPFAHLDPVGTILLILFRFGWGKPVQFDPYNLKNPIRDGALIALAGPATNVAVALILSLLHHALGSHILLDFILFQVIILNIILAIFNLVPVYPLDGSKILLALLPRHLAIEYDEIMHRYGMFILILLIFPLVNGQSPVSFLISPIIDWLIRVLIGP